MRAGVCTRVCACAHKSAYSFWYRFADVKNDKPFLEQSEPHPPYAGMDIGSLLIDVPPADGPPSPQAGKVSTPAVCVQIISTFSRHGGVYEGLNAFERPPEADFAFPACGEGGPLRDGKGCICLNGSLS